MSIMDWLRGRRADNVAAPIDAGNGSGVSYRERIDPETGEIIREPVGVENRARRVVDSPEGSTERPVEGEGSDGRGGGASPAREVVGERNIPSVNREQSVRSRISNLLAVGTITLLGGGFLAWYYTTQFAKADEAREAAARAAAARTDGEMRVPPLGRLDPPTPPGQQGGSVERVADGGLLGAPPAPPQQPGNGAGGAGAAPAGPPQKTPAQLALERQLGEPVMKRMQGLNAPSAPPLQAPGAGPQGNSALAAILAAQSGQGRGSADASASGLGGMLVPTPTPAVEAQVLPTRRFLLPKSAFVDCTLETAIDSTYDGLVTCIGANDVYSADGKVVLLERGTKYVGEKRGEVKQGQGRVFVLWSEARTPTGVVARLDSPGTDELGRAGLPGYVDTHFWDRFGSAIMISVIDGALQAIAASQRDGGTTVQIGPGGAKDVITEILKGTVAIPPTVIKNQGDRIQIVVARDVDFRSVYALKTTTPN